MVSYLRIRMAEKAIDSDSELARLTGIHRNTIRKLKNLESKVQVSLEVLERLCEFFDCPLTGIVEYVPSSTEKKDHP